MTIRSALPQNFMDKPATLVDDFSSAAAWTIVQNCTLADDAVNVLTGEKSTKLTTTSATGAAGTVDKTVNATFPDRRVYVKFFVETDPLTTIDTMNFFFGSVAWSKYFQCSIAYGSLRRGWNFLTFTPNDVYTYAGGENWDSTYIKIRFSVVPQVGKTAIVAFDSLYCNGIGKPKVVLTFDDAWLTAHQNAFPYLQQKGVRATIYTVPRFLRDSGDSLASALYMSQSEIKQWHDAGHCVANHTINHAFYTTSNYTASAYKDKVKQCIDWMLLNGYSRGAYHLAYPQGEYDVSVLQAMRELGIKTARAVHEGHNPVYALNDLLRLYQRPLSSSVTASRAMGYIDEAIRTGMTIFVMGHQIPIDDTTGTIDAQASLAFSLSKFQQFIDYGLERKVDFITVDEWYEGLTDPRKKVR